jgi:exodeoxyribonuclease VII large subunit
MLLREAVRGRVQAAKESLAGYEQILARRHPVNQLSEIRHRVAMLQQRLEQGVKRRLERVEERVEAADASLRMLGPGSVLARGFSYTLNAAGKVVTSAGEVAAGEVIRTHLADGVLQSRVENPPG